jgi:hypothetical protein
VSWGKTRLKQVAQSCWKITGGGEREPLLVRPRVEVGQRSVGEGDGRAQVSGDPVLVTGGKLLAQGGGQVHRIVPGEQVDLQLLAASSGERPGSRADCAPSGAVDRCRLFGADAEHHLHEGVVNRGQRGVVALGLGVGVST